MSGCDLSEESITKSEFRYKTLLDQTASGPAHPQETGGQERVGPSNSVAVNAKSRGDLRSAQPAKVILICWKDFRSGSFWTTVQATFVIDPGLLRDCTGDSLTRRP